MAQQLARDAGRACHARIDAGQRQTSVRPTHQHGRLRTTLRDPKADDFRLHDMEQASKLHANRDYLLIKNLREAGVTGTDVICHS